MSLQSVDLPVPLGDGVGAAQDVSAFALAKTIIVSGVFDFNATLIIEAAGATAGSDTFVQIAAVRKPGLIPITTVAKRMRVRVAGVVFGSGFAPNVDVAGEVSGTPATFAQLTPTPGNGSGASVDVSAIGEDRTIFVTGAFSGIVQIDGSNDDISFAQIYPSFQARDAINEQPSPVRFLRVSRRGVDPGDPGLPIVWVGGAFPAAVPPSGVATVLPERWAQTAIPAAQAATAMESSVSQLFTQYCAMRGGYVTGIQLMFDVALGAGTAVATVTVNGVPTSLSVTINAGQTTVRAFQAVGVDAFSAGDLIGVTLATSAGFTIVGSNCEVLVEVT